MKIFKKVSIASAIMVALLAFYVAPTFADPEVTSSSLPGVIYAYFHPNEPANIHHGNFSAKNAKEWNAEISAAWDSPFSKHLPGTLSAPFGIDNSHYKYDINTNEQIGINPGFGQPMGYGDTCERPTYYTTPKAIPTPKSCPVPDDNDHHHGGH